MAQEASAAEEPLEPAPEATPLPSGMARVLEPYKGDLDGMIKRRVIRVLTVQNPVLYFVDRGREVGITYESIKAFEKQLNQKLGNKIVMVYVVAIPVARDQLIPMLLSGRGDIAAAQLTITPERQKVVDFSLPGATGVREVLVTGPDAPPVASIADLSGKEVYIRASSSYAEHIAKLNKRFADEGKAPLKVTPAPEVLEGGDILEMVSAGLVPATVVDEVTADLYTQVFPNLKKHSDIASAARRHRLGLPQGQPQARRRGQRLREDPQGGHSRGQRADQQVHEEHAVGQERAERRGPEALRVDDRDSSRSTGASTTSTTCSWPPRATRSRSSTSRSAAAWARSASCRSCPPRRATRP